jgi:hypothetical protein
MCTAGAGNTFGCEIKKTPCTLKKPWFFREHGVFFEKNGAALKVADCICLSLGLYEKTDLGSLFWKLVTKLTGFWEKFCK